MKCSKVMTQKAIISLLSHNYGVAKSRILNFIRRGRNLGYLWDTIIIGESEILIYLEPGKMFWADVTGKMIGG